MGSLLEMLPPELQSEPALLAGFLALLGLILWTAGVKVARPLAAALTGASTAVTFACILPAYCTLDPVICAIIGLAVGLLVGMLAFRAVQGMILAACLAILAAGAFYQWQAVHHPWPAHHGPVAMIDPNTPAGQALHRLPEGVQVYVQIAVGRWSTIPLTLRQSMLVIGGGVAILALFMAWLLPRPTTWIMSALGGLALLLYGGWTLMAAYVPQYAHLVPTDDTTRLAIVACLLVIGLAIQRLFFWPGRREKQERAKDRPGELAPA